uniref:Uncharacterized protein n=1 Tax=Bactrocera dorsalis TaxID=27457 RepID=A0A034WW55_BACDO
MTKAGPIDNLGDDKTETVAESETFTDADTHYFSTSISSVEKPTTSFLNKRKREAATLQREKIYQGFLEELNKKDKYDEYGEGLASILRRIGKQDEELELKWHAEGIVYQTCLPRK